MDDGGFVVNVAIDEHGKDDGYSAAVDTKTTSGERSEGIGMLRGWI